eukprot:TRINITY_DN1529_c0_g1_i1.p1 TRINITY_DN1529_c0_g1~~TRINITY_DN1529_c0_g1_i1.p1  ORF type:complete len:195 (+),score=37.18 TRINITY_DN1529_c0_g1_i1:693-1277(+)
MGPYSKEAMLNFIESGVVTTFTLVWHPTLEDWRYTNFAKPLLEERKAPSSKLLPLVRTLKADNDLYPVQLRQGYLHMQGKRRDKWKMRWVVMHENLLQVCVVPGTDVKMVVKLESASVSQEMMKERNGELTFTITEMGKETGVTFWSPFQKALLEWIHELRKLLRLDHNAFPQLIQKPACAENETNLTVAFSKR